jgi:hypothetical protein
MSEYPRFRPIAIDAFDDTPELHAGISQATLGQIGFRVDSRVYGVQVTDVPELARWYGTAHAADTLTGAGPLEAVPSWTLVEGAFERTSGGVRGLDRTNTAVHWPNEATGLIHALLTPGETAGGEVAIIWRYSGADFWSVALSDDVAAVRRRTGTENVEMATAPMPSLRAGEPVSLQVMDEGKLVTVLVNGRKVLEHVLPEDEEGRWGGVGFQERGTGGALLSYFEAHPVAVDFSSVLELTLPTVGTGDTIVVSDSFEGPRADLAGRPAAEGNRTWRREYGRGRIQITGAESARVDASRERPNPGNTAYTLPWDDPGFADVAVDITPPGSGPCEGERGRAGLVFWQDTENYLMVTMYLDDMYDGASIAIFSHLDGFEEIYDAVWSMVAQKIYWGRAHRLRVVFDGMGLLTYIDDEPVLYRAVTDIYKDRGPFAINRVGIGVNWEWGDDTGSEFRNFVARSRGVMP